MSCHKRHIGMLIKCLDKKIMQQLNKEFEEYDLTVIQHEVLAYLYCHQQQRPIFQKDLEEYLVSTNPTVAGIVKRLETKGLIQREASCHDGRYKKLVLTEKGNHFFEKTSKVGIGNLEKRLTQNLGEHEVEKLIELLNKALTGFEE